MDPSFTCPKDVSVIGASCDTVYSNGVPLRPFRTSISSDVIFDNLKQNKK